MKKMYVLVVLAMLFFSGSAIGQLKADQKDGYKIRLDTLAIAYSKTTNIVFPFAVKSVDRGSEDILVQKAKGVENVLQLKAAKYGFNETNLTAITSDGQLYSFVLNYNENKPLLNLVVNKSKSLTHENFVSAESEDEAELQSYSKLAFYEKKKLHGVKDEKYDIKLQLNGLSIHEQVMYYRIKVENNSNVNYDISQLRFFIRDQRKAKRTASQEIEIYPLYIYNNAGVVQAESEISFVFALPKFTIPDKKYLAIQLMEDKGGRHLELRMKNKKLMQIRVLPVL